MKFNPNQEEVKLFWSRMCKRFNTKTIYTGGTVGKIYTKCVSLPVLNKVYKKIPEGLGEPKDWLNDRFITINRILHPVPIGDKEITPWRWIELCAHELTHKKQQISEGLYDFFYKYIKVEGFRASWEIEALKTEMALNVWNKNNLKTATQYVTPFRIGYNFSNKALEGLRTSIEVILTSYKKCGPQALNTTVSQAAIIELEKIY